MLSTPSAPFGTLQLSPPTTRSESSTPPSTLTYCMAPKHGELRQTPTSCRPLSTDASEISLTSDGQTHLQRWPLGQDWPKPHWSGDQKKETGPDRPHTQEVALKRHQASFRLESTRKAKSRKIETDLAKEHWRRGFTGLRESKGLKGRFYLRCRSVSNPAFGIHSVFLAGLIIFCSSF